MNVIEKDNVFYCDCGFSWMRGKSGSHSCGDGLRQQIRALTIENLAQREVIEAVRVVAGQSEGIVGWHQNGAVAGWDEVLPEVFDLDMSATDAFLAEVRAQGVERFLTFCGEENSVFVEEKAYYRSLADAIDEFAAQLRKEAK